MERTLTIKYNWKLNNYQNYDTDNDDVLPKHVEALEESALAHITKMLSEDFTSGELHDNIILDEEDVFITDSEGADYSGSWSVSID